MEIIKTNLWLYGKLAIYKMKKHKLSKSSYVKGMQCEKALYLSKFKPDKRTPFSKETLQLFSKGRSFEKQFKDTFLGAYDLPEILGNSISSYPQYTQEILTENKEATIFEAAILDEDILVLTDVLVKNLNQSYTIYEIKLSSILSQVLIWDISVQYYVCKRKLQNINSFNLVLRIPPDNEFEILDMTHVVENNYELVEQNIYKFKDLLEKGLEPTIEMGHHCQSPYTCDFIAYCQSLKTKSIH